MKKGKLQGKDGSEFTVFYHKDLSEADPCPIDSPEKAEAKTIMKKSLNKYLSTQGFHALYGVGKMPEIIIDDSIDSDIVETPVAGHHYKIKGLNVIAKFESHSRVEGVFTKDYYQMNYSGYEFHVPQESLLKASELELKIIGQQ